MSEGHSSEIEISQMRGDVLQAMTSFIYGNLEEIQEEILLDLFVAGDKYQVGLCDCELFQSEALTAVNHSQSHAGNGLERHLFEEDCVQDQQ